MPYDQQVSGDHHKSKHIHIMPTNHYLYELMKIVLQMVQIYMKNELKLIIIQLIHIKLYQQQIIDYEWV